MSIDKARRHRWQGEDSTFEGVIVARYPKLNGKAMVVMEDDRGLNHIYPDNPKRLVPVPADMRKPEDGGTFFEQPGDKNYAALVAKASAECQEELIAELRTTIAERDRRIAELEAGLRAVQPYKDCIVCYASTISEHDGNRVSALLDALLSDQQDP